MASKRSRRLISSVLQIMLRGLPTPLMAIVCGVTFPLVQANTSQTDGAAAQPRHHAVDYTMDGISTTALDETGTTKYRFTDVRMNHCEDDLTHDIMYPTLRVYASDHPQITAHADLSKMNGDGAVVGPYNNAKVIRAQGSDACQGPLMTTDSTYFQVLFNDDIVRTDKSVGLYRGLSIINANGLIFDNVMRQV